MERWYLSSSLSKTVLRALLLTVRYKYNVSPWFGRLSNGGWLRYSLSWVNVVVHSSFNAKLLQRVLKNGRHLSVDWDMNRLRANTLQMRRCISCVVCGGCNWMTTCIFFGLGSMPEETQRCVPLGWASFDSGSECEKFLRGWPNDLEHVWFSLACHLHRLRCSSLYGSWIWG